MHDLAAIARECVEEVNALKVSTDVVLAVVARLAVASASFCYRNYAELSRAVGALPGGTESTRTAQRHGTADKR
jgi:hypothetical protein